MNHVVIVDDDQEHARIIVEFLCENGWIAHAAYGIPAYDLCRTKQPDVIVLDMIMPGLDGWAFRQLLLSDPATAPIPVVICTGLDRKDIEIERMNAYAVIQKPYDLSHLVAVLDQAQRQDPRT